MDGEYICETTGVGFIITPEEEESVPSITILFNSFRPENSMILLSDMAQRHPKHRKMKRRKKCFG
jgi:hypothetical protein